MQIFRWTHWSVFLTPQSFPRSVTLSPFRSQHLNYTQRSISWAKSQTAQRQHRNFSPETINLPPIPPRPRQALRPPPPRIRIRAHTAPTPIDCSIKCRPMMSFRPTLHSPTGNVSLLLLSRRPSPHPHRHLSRQLRFRRHSLAIHRPRRHHRTTRRSRCNSHCSRRCCGARCCPTRRHSCD